MKYYFEKIPGELLNALMENPHESQILVDRDGIIRFMSIHSVEFYGTSQEEAIGRHILELNPESALPGCLKPARPKSAGCSSLAARKGSWRVFP